MLDRDCNYSLTWNLGSYIPAAYILEGAYKFLSYLVDSCY